MTIGTLVVDKWNITFGTQPKRTGLNYLTPN